MCGLGCKTVEIMQVMPPMLNKLQKTQSVGRIKALSFQNSFYNAHAILTNP